MGFLDLSNWKLWTLLSLGFGLLLSAWLFGFIVAKPDTLRDIVTDNGANTSASLSEDFEAFVYPTVKIIIPRIIGEVTSNGYAPNADLVVATVKRSDDDGSPMETPVIYIFGSNGLPKVAFELTNKMGAILGDRRFLADGRIMFTVFRDGTYILDPESGKIDWGYFDNTVSHHAELLPNGNVLTVGSYCDCLKEIDYRTKKIIWQWKAKDTFGSYSDPTVFSGADSVAQGNSPHYSVWEGYTVERSIFPDDWTHLNHAQYLQKSDTFLVSLRNFDIVAEITRHGQIVWSFGPGIIKHQHTPRDLGDGSMLVFDNGNNRAIRVDRASQVITWTYGRVASHAMGDFSLLDDGNYKILDSVPGRIDIVSPDYEVLWSMDFKKLDGTNQGLIYRANFEGIER